MLLTEECKCINRKTHVAAIVSAGCIAHQHCLNRYDFNLCLKTGKLREGSLKSSGSLFQRVGPEVAKLRGPIVFVFVLSTRRSPLTVERRRERDGTVDFSTSISVRYAGAIPWRFETLVDELGLLGTCEPIGNRHSSIIDSLRIQWSSVDR